MLSGIDNGRFRGSPEDLTTKRSDVGTDFYDT